MRGGCGYPELGGTRGRVGRRPAETGDSRVELGGAEWSQSEPPQGIPNVLGGDLGTQRAAARDRQRPGTAKHSQVEPSGAE